MARYVVQDETGAQYEVDDGGEPSPAPLGGTDATIQSNDKPWPTGTDWIRQGLFAATGDELFNGQGGMPIESPTSDKPVQEAGIRSAASKVMEVGSGLAAATGMAAAAPESFGTTALAIPAAYTGGELAGHAAGTELGLNAPESVMSPPGKSIYSPGEVAKRFAVNAAFGTGLATYDRIANRGVIGAIPGVSPTGGIDLANSAGASEAAMAEQLGKASSPGVHFTTPAGLAEMEGSKVGGLRSIVESDPGVIETGFYGGGQKFDLTPGSDTFGKFVPGEGGALNKTAVDASATLKSELPRMMQARDEMITQYDQALGVLKQADPTSVSGITANEILNAPIAPGGPTLSESFSSIINGKQLSGVSNKTAEALQNEAMAIRTAALSQGEYAPGQALKAIQDIDNAVEALGGWESNPNIEQGRIDQARIELYKTARAYWKNAFDNGITRINGAAQTSGAVGRLAPIEDIQRLNDAWSSLQPISRQLDHYSAQFSMLAQGGTFPSAPGNPAAPAYNFLNPFNSNSPINKGLSKVVNGFTDPQAALHEYRQSLIQANQNVYSNAQGFLKSQGVEFTPRPRSNLLQGTLTKVAGIGGAVGTAGVAQAQDLQPSKGPVAPPPSLSVSLMPPPPVPKDGFQVPRNLSVLDPQGVANLITGVAAPQDIQPLIFQWQRLVAAGDKRQMAQFLGLLSDAHPDFPLARGAVTGLASEFDVGDGRPRLFTPQDKVKWEGEIDRAPISAFEKAQRLMALRKDGLVIPFTTRTSPPAQPGSADFKFSPRQQTTMGSRRIEQ